MAFIDIFAWVVFLLLVSIIVGVVVLLGLWPGKVAQRVNLHLALLFICCGLTSAAGASESAGCDSLQLLGHEIACGTSSKFPFVPDRSFEASYLNMPVFAARGISPGPTLCVAAGVHGDEINGVEVARRSFAQIDPQNLRGTLIVLPAINAEGVRSGDRYLSDRRDLNRAFPGRAGGSVASVIAHAVFTQVKSHCDALIDLHTGSNQRTNLPQIRADLADPAIRDLAIHFGLGIVVGGAGPDGSLRREAAKAGIPRSSMKPASRCAFRRTKLNVALRGSVTFWPFWE